VLAGQLQGYAPEPNPETKKKDVVWFTLNDDRPLTAFAGYLDRSRRALLTHRAPPSGQTLCDERVAFVARRAAIIRIDAAYRLSVRTAAANRLDD
jgi:hypothetical protein